MISYRAAEVLLPPAHAIGPDSSSTVNVYAGLLFFVCRALTRKGRIQAMSWIYACHCRLNVRSSIEGDTISRNSLFD